MVDEKGIEPGVDAYALNDANFLKKVPNLLEF